MLQKLHPVSWSAAAKKRLFTRIYAHTDIIKHQLEVYSTHVCPSVLEAPCSHPEPCTRCAYVGKQCNIASTPLPWQYLPCESADPCFMAAGSTQNACTTRPLSPEDETMMKALHDKWGIPSNPKFIQIYRTQHRVGFPTNFLSMLNRFRCKVCALCKGAQGYRSSTRLQLHGLHKAHQAVPAPVNVVFCNSNDDSTIGVVTAALLDDLFTVLMPTHHTQNVFLVRSITGKGDHRHRQRHCRRWRRHRAYAMRSRQISHRCCHATRR